MTLRTVALLTVALLTMTFTYYDSTFCGSTHYDSTDRCVYCLQERANQRAKLEEMVTAVRKAEERAKEAEETVRALPPPCHTHRHVLVWPQPPPLMVAA